MKTMVLFTAVLVPLTIIEILIEKFFPVFTIAARSIFVYTIILLGVVSITIKLLKYLNKN